MKHLTLALALLTVCCSLAADAPAPQPAPADAPVNPFNQYLPSDDPADCASCKKNLEKEPAFLEAELRRCREDGGFFTALNARLD